MITRLKFIPIVAITLLISIFPGCSDATTDNPIIAHRGAWKANGHPQNSIAALKEAIKMGVSGSEFDVHITKDDSLVVTHDRDYKGMDIGESSYKELWAETLSNGEKLPTVREYIQEGLKQEHTKLILEIKPAATKERTLELTRKAVELVREMTADNLVEYITFDYEAGKLVHQLDEDAEVAYLNGDVPPLQAKNDGYTGLDYNYKKYKEHPDWISQAKELGLTINAWTVNSESEMKNLLEQGVTYITTDEPELLFKILSEKK